MSVTVSHGHRHWHSTAARLSVGAPPGVTVIPNAAAAQARPQRPAATIAAAAATAGHGHSDCRDGWWRVIGRRIPSRAGDHAPRQCRRELTRGPGGLHSARDAGRVSAGAA